jgi:hypothetical protein
VQRYRIGKTSIQVSWRNLMEWSRETGAASRSITLRYYHLGQSGLQLRRSQLRNLGTKMLHNPFSQWLIPTLIVRGPRWGEAALEYGSGYFSPTPWSTKKELVGWSASQLMARLQADSKTSQYSNLINTQNLGQIPFEAMGKVRITHDKQGVLRVHFILPKQQAGRRPASSPKLPQSTKRGP